MLIGKQKNSYLTPEFTQIKSLFDEYSQNLCTNQNCMNCDHLAQRVYYLNLKNEIDRSKQPGVLLICFRRINFKVLMINLRPIFSDSKCKFCDNNHTDYSCPIFYMKRELSALIQNVKNCVYCGNDGHQEAGCPKYRYEALRNQQIGLIQVEESHFDYIKTLTNIEDKKVELENIRKILVKFRNKEEGKYLRDGNDELGLQFKRFDKLFKDVCYELQLC